MHFYKISNIYFAECTFTTEKSHDAIRKLSQRGGRRPPTTCGGTARVDGRGARAPGAAGPLRMGPYAHSRDCAGPTPIDAACALPRGDDTRVTCLQKTLHSISTTVDPLPCFSLTKRGPNKGPPVPGKSELEHRMILHSTKLRTKLH